MNKEKFYFDLCEQISREVKAALIKRLKKFGFIGDTNLNPKDMKSTHEIDIIAAEIVERFLSGHKCNIRMESFDPIIKGGAEFSILIDLVDGSLNFDRGVGDPCVVIAISEKTEGVTFGDLSFAYVQGLRSGDKYYCREGKSFFFSSMTKMEYPIACKQNITLDKATTYLRFGYSLAERQLKRTSPFLLLCKDTRSFENTGVEICDIARNAAHLLIEARRESDHFNLLAYPILKNAGGFMTRLDGVDIADTLITTEGKLDFIACCSKNLLKEALLIMRLIEKQ